MRLYVFTIMNRLGRAVQFFIGSPINVERVPNYVLVVDQRDGFEVAFFPCASSPVAASPAQIS